MTILAPGTLIIGDALTELRNLDDASVNCCVTSPPYWGLRDYGTEPTIWGGDPGCEHDWQECIQPAADGTLLQEGNSALRAGHQGSTSATLKPKRSAFCSKCGAWRGQLGLEPTPQLFVEHLVEVFREVRRVLRPDGTLWVNLGDSYFGSSTAASDHKNFGRDMVADGRWPADKSVGGANPNHKNIAWPGARTNPSAYWNLKPKDLCGIPWAVAFALRADGYYLRSDIIWHKPNPMPESVTDRPTKAHEYLFLLAKAERYYYNAKAIAEPAAYAGEVKDYTGDQKANTADPVLQRTRPRGRVIVVGPTRNARDVWVIPFEPYPEAHFAVMPQELARRCILAGCPEGGTVLDPFMGAGTTALAAQELGRLWIGIELQPEYEALIRRRVRQDVLPLGARA